MRESSGRPAGHEALLLCKLIELIVFLARQYEKIETKDEFALLRIGRVISALESDFQRSWAIDSLARLAHLSASQLNRVFKQATGQTPIDYLIKLRLQQAMRLLRTSELTMTQIASRVGFDDSNYFSRQFHKVHKISPSRYRQQTRQAGVSDGEIDADDPWPHRSF
jgi:transcriptional regulator GlxA family with amidase domain